MKKSNKVLAGVAGLVVTIAGGWGLSGNEQCPKGLLELPSHNICVPAADKWDIEDLVASPTIEEYLQGKTAKDKAKWKATGIFLESKDLKKFTRDGIKVLIDDIAVDNKDRLVVIMTASQNGVQLYVDNPYYFINPPILLPDPNGSVIRTSIIDGVKTVHKYREDAQEVLKTILIETIKLQNP